MQTVNDLPAGTSYFTADCLILPTRANYTDYSCESCTAKLCNYKNPVWMIMRYAEKKKKTDGDFGFPSNESIRSFSSMCGRFSKRLHEDTVATHAFIPAWRHQNER